MNVDELARRYGLELQDTHDDLGNLRLALARWGDVPFSIERHSDEPGPGTMISILDSDVAPWTIDDLLHGLRIDPDELLWTMPHAVATRRAKANKLRQRGDAKRPLTALTALALLVARYARRRSTR